jgi:hypothetical protein
MQQADNYRILRKSLVCCQLSVDFLIARCKIHINKRSYPLMRDLTERTVTARENNDMVMLPEGEKSFPDERCTVFQLHELYAERMY